jgi:hypothetical protein
VETPTAQKPRLWELADLAAARLHKMSNEEKAAVLDLLEVRVTLADERPPIKLRIEGVVYDEIVSAMRGDGQAFTSAGGPPGNRTLNLRIKRARNSVRPRARWCGSWAFTSTYAISRTSVMRPRAASQCPVRLRSLARCWQRSSYAGAAFASFSRSLYKRTHGVAGASIAM